MDNFSPWLVMLIGIGTVFVGLVFLILLTKIMSFVLGGGKKDETANSAALETPEAPPAVEESAELSMPDRKCFDAVVAAAIASYIGGDVSGLRIRSVKRLGGGDSDHNELVSVIAASIATVMGTDVNGLRIRSIRKI